MTKGMEDALMIKKSLYKRCCDFVNNRDTNIQNTITELQESLTSETKSSAGDKHETGRAMIQLELEKSADQQKETRKLQEVLSKIDVAKSNNNIGLGSVVYTTQTNYFIAISAGKFTIEAQNFYAISLNTPIGELLFGKKRGETIDFRGDKIKILDAI